MENAEGQTVANEAEAAGDGVQWTVDDEEEPVVGTGNRRNAGTVEIAVVIVGAA